MAKLLLEPSAFVAAWSPRPGVVGSSRRSKSSHVTLVHWQCENQASKAPLLQTYTGGQQLVP